MLTPLHKAISQKNVNQVRKLLAKHADPNCERITDRGNRYSALYDAIDVWPDDQIAELLIQFGANVNYVASQNGSKIPVLNCAICHGNTVIVGQLLNHKANPDSERLLAKGDCYSALFDAINVWPDDQIAELLIQFGANVNYVATNDGCKIPILNAAIKEKNLTILQMLLKCRANPDSERILAVGARYSALYDAIHIWPNDQIAKTLIQFGANVNYAASQNGSKIPVLNIAISHGNTVIVDQLLNHKANPDSERILAVGDRYSALYDAIHLWPNDQIAKTLIQFGANVNYAATCLEGSKIPILNSAILKGNVGIVRQLLNHKASPDSERVLAKGDHCSALYDAEAVWPNKEIAEMLKNAGAKYKHTTGPTNTDTPKKESAPTPQPSKQQDSNTRPQGPGADQLQQELNSLVGLTEVKKNVTEMINILKLNDLRSQSGLPPINVAKHMVFTGNPGTGKTTVARILAGIYKELGVLSKGQMIEVDRSGLVAEYVGQTEAKVQGVIQQAMGGILFIDEAYALSKKGSGNDYGQDAINTILKAMEDNRDDLVVIAAGYPDLMENFINSNPGLQSRFTKYIHFADYTAEEMQQIFKRMAAKDGYNFDRNTEMKLLELWRMSQNAENFGNGRGVRNVYETILSNQASRVVALPNPTKEILLRIVEQDVPDTIKIKK